MTVPLTPSSSGISEASISAAWTPRAKIVRNFRVAGSCTLTAMLSTWTSDFRRSAISSSTVWVSSVVKIDSVTRNSSRWLSSWRASLSDCARRRSVASALATACAAIDA